MRRPRPRANTSCARPVRARHRLNAAVGMWMATSRAESGQLGSRRLHMAAALREQEIGPRTQHVRCVRLPPRSSFGVLLSQDFNRRRRFDQVAIARCTAAKEERGQACHRATRSREHAERSCPTRTLRRRMKRQAQADPLLAYAQRRLSVRHGGDPKVGGDLIHLA